MNEIAPDLREEPDPKVDAPHRAEAEARQRRGTRQLLIARALFMVSSYLASVILARALGPDGFGVYGILLSTLLWLEMVSTAGIPAALGKLLPDHQEQATEVEQSAHVVLLAISLGLFVVGWALAPLVARLFHLTDGARLFRLAILDIPFATAFAGYSGMLMGRRRFGALSTSQIVLGAAKFIGILSLVAFGISVGRALVVNVLSSCTVLVYLVVRYPPKMLRPVWAMVQRLISVGVPIAVFLVALQVLISLDLWFLGSLWHGSEAAIGQYVAALKIAQSLIVIPIVQSGVLLASVAWALASKDRVGARRHVLEASRFALILAAPACVIVGSSASSLMGVVYSSKYAPGGAFLAIQLVAFSCFGFLDTFAHALMAAGRQRIIAIVLLAFIPIVGIANLLLIPRLGPMGAAISLLIGMLGVAIVIGALVWQQFGAPLGLGTLGRVAVASTVVAIPGMLISTSGPLVLVKMAGLGGVYLLVLRLLGEISGKDFTLPRVQLKAEA